MINRCDKCGAKDVIIKHILYVMSPLNYMRAHHCEKCYIKLHNKYEETYEISDSRPDFKSVVNSDSDCGENINSTITAKL
ncbi:MAG TPA: hypothetical protein VNX68_07970 [Nitrosopumilaceae archaeon]|jgi:hypothetical protein|nr:hypothetical protein [Nitrosopumilaceae archaeon]